ncbi:flavin reductase family protein [Chloroflexi bacterium TSY]|nr:flavin reductase family protein [Chloroflexi bacterium TSY]
MQLNPETVETPLIYKLLTGTVVPRPIGWISTVDKDGVNNLAPYSFFNAVSADPPHVLFGSGRRAGADKDSAGNALATGEFVVNLVSVDPNLAFLAIFSRDCRDFGVIYSDFGYRKQPISYLKIAQI